MNPPQYTNEKEQLHKEFLDDLRKDPNNLSFWYPKVKDAAKSKGILTPKTVIIPVPDEVIGSFFPEKEGDEERVRAFVHEKVMPKLKQVNGLPFIKNGTFSDKFKFKACCPDTADEDTICKSVSDIQNDAFWYNTGGVAEIVLRERIESPESMPRIYGGMPLNTEFRVFYDFDKKAALYIANYWDWDYCSEAICHRGKEDRNAYESRYPSLLAEYVLKRNFVLSKAHSVLSEVEGIEGIWSVDFLLDSRDRLWLIDMAVGNRSAYWDAARATALRNQAEIKLYIDKNDPDGRPDIAVWVRELFQCAREDNRDFIKLCNDSVIRAWQKAHPDILLPETSPKRELAFMEHTGTEDIKKLKIRWRLDHNQENSKKFSHLLEYLTAMAVETVVNDYINK